MLFAPHSTNTIMWQQCPFEHSNKSYCSPLMATSQQDLLLEGLWRYHVVKWTKDGGTWWGYPEIFMKRWPLLSFFSLLHIYVNLLFTTNACLIQINWTCQLTGQCQNIRLTWQAQTSQFSFDFPGECSSTQTKSFWVSTFSTDKINMPEKNI